MVALVTSGIFFAGYRTASICYERDIAQAKAKYAADAKLLEEQYREREREQIRQLSEAIDKMENARNRADVLLNRTVRMQHELDQANRRVSDLASRSGDACTKRLSESLEIIRRYDEIASRGLRLAQDISVKKDAIVEITY